MSRLTYLQNKIVSPEDAARKIATWQFKGEKVVFTNGCFDILHMGHVTYLAKAADEGNRLVIGLNTDYSVKAQNKGEDRPINNEEARSLVLAAIGVVDLVVLFDEQTPFELIKTLHPDVLVKGADYDPNEKNKNSKKYIVGSELVSEYGGKVVAIPLVEGFSTTSLINRINNQD